MLGDPLTKLDVDIELLRRAFHDGRYCFGSTEETEAAKAHIRAQRKRLKEQKAVESYPVADEVECLKVTDNVVCLDIPEKMIIDVTDALENTRFPACDTRKNVVDHPVPAMCLGAVQTRGQGQALSRYTLRHEGLVRLLCQILKTVVPGFTFTSLQVNGGYSAKMHVDG